MIHMRKLLDIQISNDKAHYKENIFLEINIGSLFVEIQRSVYFQSGHSKIIHSLCMDLYLYNFNKQ